MIIDITFLWVLFISISWRDYHMAKKLLIDAKQPEETRVVLLNQNRVEDFDQETSTKIQNKGNIYLARVTRVEPSLQAAFVEYGGSRHGFLAFNEIHPDYYRIPVEDRKALAEEMVSAENENNADQEETKTENILNDQPETIGSFDETPIHTSINLQKKYKIQEVISKRQILLVQVSKEERGNKGAALTSYISLAGRYCVLMPNTVRRGGVSRKITKIEDRNRLKKIIEEIKMPEGMAVIIRTAGSERTKTELKRDLNYLQKLWNEIREKTLNSTAPSLINEEGNLIKRTIRDLYTNEVGEIIVSGDLAYNTAREYLKMMIPNHMKKVKSYDDLHLPIFQKFNVEKQLDLMHLPTVTLKSGGYIVINQTEALVAIDVNSGKATKERNIEETALATNIEAAQEVARQLKLRDLSGLIVIDFIDMEGAKNQHSVERHLKDAMSTDRARIQIGRISHFGLMELSRQRLRPSVSENYFSSCEVCGGTGFVRSVESSSLKVLRKIEEGNFSNESINVTVPKNIGLYLLNQKRKSLIEIEENNNLNIIINFDDSNIDIEIFIQRTSEIKNKTHKPTSKNLSSSSSQISENKNALEEKNKTKQRRGKRGGKGRKKFEPTLIKNVDNTSDETNILNNQNSQLNENLGNDSESNSKSLNGKSSKSKKSSSNIKKNVNKKLSDKRLPSINSKANSNPKNIKPSIVSEKSRSTKKTKKDKTELALKEEIKLPSRKAISSEPLDIVDVGDSNLKKRDGWWSQNKK